MTLHSLQHHSTPHLNLLLKNPHQRQQLQLRKLRPSQIKVGNGEDKCLGNPKVVQEHDLNNIVIQIQIQMALLGKNDKRIPGDSFSDDKERDRNELEIKGRKILKIEKVESIGQEIMPLMVRHRIIDSKRSGKKNGKESKIGNENVTRRKKDARNGEISMGSPNIANNVFQKESIESVNNVFQKEIVNQKEININVPKLLQVEGLDLDIKEVLTNTRISIRIKITKIKTPMPHDRMVSLSGRLDLLQVWERENP